jgi:hypothetical protein
MGTATRHLEEAFARARELPPEEQDALAEGLFEDMAWAEREARLTPEQAAEVKRIQQDLRTGTTRLATDEEVEAAWTKFEG